MEFLLTSSTYHLTGVSLTIPQRRKAEQLHASIGLIIK